MSDDGNVVDLDGVRADIENAAPPAGPPETEVQDGEFWPLPGGCPVTPLGTRAGVYFYINSGGEFIELKERDHGRLYIEGLFNLSTNYLWDHYEGRRLNPKYDPDDPTSEKWHRTGKIQIEKIAWDLRKACAFKGVWDPQAKMRGVGAWRGEEGELILHCGDAIWHSDPAHDEGGRWKKIGALQGHVYPAMPKQPRPLGERVPGGYDDSAVGALFDALESWSFKRAEVDHLLMAGWIGAAMLGGALPWRPAAWVTGDKGTGKSTLLDVVQKVLGGGAIATSDATAAGIWQHVGLNSIPVILDEQEAEEDPRKAQNILKLARQAASGGVVLRGGANHQGSEFTARSCFLFSSILVPPMQAQDRSRMAILELGPLAGGPEPELAVSHWGPIGRALRQRMVMGWPRFAETRAAYYEALKSLGHEARGADQFGVLLSAADLLIYDTHPDPKRLADMTAGLAAGALSETAGSEPDWKLCLRYLLDATLDVVKDGARLILSEWIAMADQPPPASGLKMDAWDDEGGKRDPSAAEKAIARTGIKIHQEQSGTQRRAQGTKWLVIAVSHQRLAQIFRETKWASMPGTQGSGWSQALARAPGAVRDRTRFGGNQGWAIFLPWGDVFDDEKGDEE